MSTRGLCSHGVRVGAGFECATCVTTPAAGTPDDMPFSPLVADILTQMAKDTAFTTNALIANHEAQNKALKAELLAIRQGVTDLLANPWVPSSDAIRRAVFYPVTEEVDW